MAEASGAAVRPHLCEVCGGEVARILFHWSCESCNCVFVLDDFCENYGHPRWKSYCERCR